MPYKDIDGVITRVLKEFKLGDEARVPYLDGVKGIITSKNKDLYEIEYTHPKTGVKRREQFYRDEYPDILLADLYDEAYQPDPQNPTVEDKEK